MRKGVVFSLVLAIITVGSAAAAWRHANPGKTTRTDTATTTEPKLSEEPKQPTSSSASVTSPPATSSTSSSVSTNSTSVNGVSSTQITITADDNSASQTTIGIDAGTKVTITFQLNPSTTTYDGGLIFRSTGISPALNTGVVTVKTPQILTFMATQSFDFIPYWPTTNTQKPYKISITVH